MDSYLEERIQEEENITKRLKILAATTIEGLFDGINKQQKTVIIKKIVININNVSGGGATVNIDTTPA